MKMKCKRVCVIFDNKSSLPASWSLQYFATVEDSSWFLLSHNRAGQRNKLFSVMCGYVQGGVYGLKFQVTEMYVFI